MLTPGPRRLASRAAAAAVVASAIVLPLTGALPAHADQARQRQMWVLNALNVPNAWKITKGQGVTVAVIDSGVDPTVSDLTGQVTTGPNLTGVDTPTSNPNWGAHGTWMASLIAGHGHGKGDKDGILGVAPESRILSVRVITDRTDPNFRAYQREPAYRGQSELARAIRFAVKKHAGVISMSLGYNAPSSTVRSALQYALTHNVVVVASSGNSRQMHSPYSFPADYPGVIGVAAVNQAGQPASFSDANLSVEVAAPGVNVPAQGRGSKYWVVSGTSPACALTAGVAALVKSKYPKLSAAQVRDAIVESTAHRPKDGYDDSVGFGTVDAAKALQVASRLGSQVPAGRTRAGQLAAAGTFSGGSTRTAAFPIAPQSKNRLYKLLGIGAGSLLVLILALWWLVRSRRRRASFRRATVSGPRGPAAGRGSVAGGADVRYPTQIFPAKPFRQGRPAPGTVMPPGYGYPAAGFPGQPPGAPGAPGAPGQADDDGGLGPWLGYGTAGHPGQAPAGQGHPGPGYGAQDFAGKDFTGSGYPNQGYPDQGYPPPAYPGSAAYLPGAAPGAGYPGPGYGGSPWPDNGGQAGGWPGSAGPAADWTTAGGPETGHNVVTPGYQDATADHPDFGPEQPDVADAPTVVRSQPGPVSPPPLPPGQGQLGAAVPPALEPAAAAPAASDDSDDWAFEQDEQSEAAQPDLPRRPEPPVASAAAPPVPLPPAVATPEPPAGDALPARPSPPPASLRAAAPSAPQAGPGQPPPEQPQPEQPQPEQPQPEQPQSDMERWLADPLTSPRIPDSVLGRRESWQASRLGERFDRTDVTRPFRSPTAGPGQAEPPAVREPQGSAGVRACTACRLAGTRGGIGRASRRS